MTLAMIISGGQTGADQGALAAARELGIPTGGYMPYGWRTEAGPAPELAARYNMWEHRSASYIPRTKANVFYAHATLIFGNEHSPGCKLTLRECQLTPRKYTLFPWHRRDEWPPATWPLAAEGFAKWLERENVCILNVAGNREEKNPGIFEAVKLFLTTALGRQ